MLAPSVGAGVLVMVFRRPTSSRAMILPMLAGVGVVLLWRCVGYDQAPIDVVPGLLAVLAVSAREAVD